MKDGIHCGMSSLCQRREKQGFSRWWSAIASGENWGGRYGRNINRNAKRAIQSKTVYWVSTLCKEIVLEEEKRRVIGDFHRLQLRHPLMKRLVWYQEVNDKEQGKKKCHKLKSAGTRQVEEWNGPGRTERNCQIHLKGSPSSAPADCKPSIHSINIYCVPTNILYSSGHWALNQRDKSPCHCGTYLWMERDR